MKKNNKGFTLIETLIVSTFVIGTLTYLFIQIDNTITNYDITFRYDNINSIYKANQIADFIQRTDFSNLISEVNSNGYADITSSAKILGNSEYYNYLLTETNVKTIIFTKENLETAKNSIKNSSYSEELKRYITKHDSNTSSKSKYLIIVEFKDNTFASIKVG